MAPEQDTQHAILVPWGHFAGEIGLLSGIEAIKLNQKVYEHTPQAKVIEFLVAILSGAKYLQDISLAAHPLDRKWEVVSVDLKAEKLNHKDGCAYYGRCAFAFDKCNEKPPLVETVKGHSVACWKHSAV